MKCAQVLSIDDFKDLFFQMFDTNNNNNPAVNLYTVKPVQGKGLGLIASRGLKGLYSCKLLQWLKYNPYFRRHIAVAGVMLRVRVSPHDDEGEGGEG